MGKIVSICNNKGGVGKTTSNIHLACALRDMGKKILIVDLEYPGYSSAFFIEGFDPFSTSDDRIMALFKENDVPEPLKPSENVHVYPSVDLINGVDQAHYDAIYAFRTHLLEISDDYDYVIIDSPPLLNLRLDCILAVCDFIFVVIEPVPFSFGGLVSFNNQYQKIRSRINSALPEFPIIFFNKYSGIAKHRHSASVEEFKDAYPNHLILPHVLKLRSPIVDAVSQGMPAWDFQKAKVDVREEFKNVFFSLANILESNQWKTS